MGEDDALENEMLEFPARWFRLGGGPSHEILTQFGMTNRTFFTEMDASRTGIGPSITSPHVIPR